MKKNKKNLKKKTIGLYSLTSCGGDLVNILNIETSLEDVFDAFDVVSFSMAFGTNKEVRNMDAAIIEGCVTQRSDLELLKSLRERSKNIIAVGSCAVHGGIPSMLNKTEVYGTNRKVSALPLKNYVKVDFSIPGCPIERPVFLEFLECFRNGYFPEVLNFPVCHACKLKENPCIITENKDICCGPLTMDGCHARCPSIGIPCNGCFGPIEEAAYDTQYNLFRDMGFTKKEIIKKMRYFSMPAWIPEIMEQIEK